MTTTSQRPWMDEVQKSDPDFYKERRAETCYEFSNRRKFISSDGYPGGVYRHGLVVFDGEDVLFDGEDVIW